MGAIGGMFGASGGASGTGFSAPQSTQGLIDPTNINNLNSVNQGVVNSTGSQNQLLAALQAQNGLNNQTQNYNQLQGVINGTGANPAQAQLAQATGTNVSNQAALMAGQRGAGANVGLIARQAAQQGANTQQQAAGQAATMQANQSLNALGQAGTMANTQAASQVGQTNANTQAQLQQQQNLYGAQGAMNSALVSNQASLNQGNAALAQTGMQGQQKVAGGIMGGVGSILGMADGGQVPSNGGGITPDASAFSGAGPQSKFGQFLKGMGTQMSGSSAPVAAGSAPANSDPLQGGAQSLTSGLIKALKGGGSGGANDQTLAGGPDNSDLTDYSGMAARGGEVDIVVSPGEKILPPGAVEKVKMGADPMKVGKTVPGKPKVDGAKNSYSNDTVPTKAAAGTIIVPRSETKSKNPSKNSEKFIAGIIAKRKKR